MPDRRPARGILSSRTAGAGPLASWDQAGPRSRRRVPGPRVGWTVVRESLDDVQWQQLTDAMRDAAGILARGLAGAWTLDGLTALVYAVPKLMLGLPADAAPTAEVKAAQREFFRALYRLICGSDTGPRLPTLMLSIGPDRTAALLAGPDRVPAA
jgi:lysyl-tRNA synthetase class 1